MCSGPGLVVVHVCWKLLLPLIEQGFAEPTPDPVQQRGQCDGSLFGRILGKHDDHVHLLLCWQLYLFLHLLVEFQEGLDS